MTDQPSPALGAETPLARTTWRAPRERAAIWRIVVGLLLILAVYLGLNATAFVAFALIRGIDRADMTAAEAAVASSPSSALLLFLTFVPMLIAPLVAVRLVHREPAGTLIGPPRRVLRDFAFAAGTVAVLYGVALGLWSLGAETRPNLPVGIWLLLLPVTLTVVGIQTLAEELVFRGYLQRYLAARFAHRAVWLVLPSLLFAGLHYDPVMMGPSAGHAVVAALVFGLAAGDLTARTGSIGAAWGLHFANNAVALAILATDGTITGLALRVTPYDVSEIVGSPLLVLADILPLAAVWAWLRWRLGRSR